MTSSSIPVIYYCKAGCT